MHTFSHMHTYILIYMCVCFIHIYVLACKQVGTEWDDDPKLAPFLTC